MKLLLEKADSSTRVRHNVTVGVSDLEVEGKPMLVLCLKATRDIKEGTCLSIDIAAHTTAVAPRGDVPDAARGKRIAAFPGLHLEFEMGSNKRVRRAIAEGAGKPKAKAIAEGAGKPKAKAIAEGAGKPKAKVPR
jgi:hypothetical protein